MKPGRGPGGERAMEDRIAAAIAANRYGLGARPGELDRIGTDPRGWLREQIEGPPPLLRGADLPSSAQILSAAFGPADDAPPAERFAAALQEYRRVYSAEVAARFASAVATDRPFVERLTHFWTNHFAVSVDKLAVVGVAGALEREAIRPHVLERFVDMLLAVERHPAMLLYLDNYLSVGPGSPVATYLAARRKARPPGLNENLAREILELHTLGVDGPYGQDDVIRLAEVLTGWSIGGTGRMPRAVLERLGADLGEPGAFRFRPALHEPGAKEVRGRRDRDSGEARGEAVRRGLAAHPSTARCVATKLARHFIADEPADAAVARIERAFVESDGDLPSVYAALIDAAEAWREPLAKFKTPNDYVISTYRGLEIPTTGRPREIAAFETLGQKTYAPGSPAGWPDLSSSWDGASALLARIEWAAALGARIGSRRRAATLAPQLLGGTLSATTLRAIELAATAEQALTLLLAAPEFMRR